MNKLFIARFALLLLIVAATQLGVTPLLGASPQTAQVIEQPDLDALKVIASRRALTRLDFDEDRKVWSLYHGSLLMTLVHFVKSKSRYDIILPLENLIENVELGYLNTQNKDPSTYNLIRRAYASLSSLYSYYKINPDNNTAKQADFIGRFGVVLNRFKSIISEIENKTPLNKRYQALPWYGDSGESIHDGDRKIGLHYLNMGQQQLAELNETLRSIGNTDTSIDRAMEFYPKERTSLFRSSFSNTARKKIVMFLVHGTFAKDSAEYQSDDHILFQQAKYMAQSVANDQNVPVEVYSFGWSGANDNEARMDAGEELTNFVQTYFPPEEYDDIYIGHSHGGNVVMHFAKTLREYRTPYMVITIATPIRKDFMTDNLNYLFQFYTDSDWIQYYGSYEMTLRNNTTTGTHAQNPRMLMREDLEKLGLFAHNDRFNRVKIYATRVYVNQKSLKGRISSHVNIKYLIGVLPRILDQILKHAPNTRLELDVKLDETSRLSVDQMESLQYQLAPALS